jgi:hypothetical protein
MKAVFSAGERLPADLPISSAKGRTLPAILPVPRCVIQVGLVA